MKITFENKELEIVLNEPVSVEELTHNLKSVICFDVTVENLPEPFMKFILYKRIGSLHYFRNDDSKVIMSLTFNLPYGSILNLYDLQPEAPREGLIQRNHKRIYERS